MFKNLLSYHRGSTFSNIRLASAAKYGLISMFPLPYKHVWTLSYTYRVLISPINESLEQRNNKTKLKHNNFPCCERWLRRGVALLCCGVALRSGVAPLPNGEPEDGQILHSAMPRHGMPRRGVDLCCGVGSLRRGVGPRQLA